MVSIEMTQKKVRLLDPEQDRQLCTRVKRFSEKGDQGLKHYKRSFPFGKVVGLADSENHRQARWWVMNRRKSNIPNPQSGVCDHGHTCTNRAHRDLAVLWTLFFLCDFNWRIQEFGRHSPYGDS